MNGRSPRPCLVIVNRAASRAGDVRASVDRLRASTSVRVSWPARPEDLDDELARAVADDHTIVVAGGDGTVRGVVQRLVELAVVERSRLGVLPYGRCNGLARRMRIPLDPGAAATVILAGNTAARPLVTDREGNVVVNGVAFGPGAAAPGCSPCRPAWQRPCALARAAIPAPVLSVEVDHADTWEGQAYLVSVTDAAPCNRDPTAWCLRVTVVPGPSLRHRVVAAWRHGGGRETDDSAAIVASGCEVALSGDAICAASDGETVPVDGTVSYRVAPSAWSLVVPAPADATAR